MISKKQNLGYLYAAGTCFIWGSIYVAAKYALQSLGPVELICLRYIVALVSLYILLTVKKGRKKVEKGDWKYFWIVGGVGYFGSIVFQMVGTKLLDASLASLINSLNPVSISIFAAVFLGEKIRFNQAAGIAVSLVGVYVILGVGGASINVWGAAASVGSVLLWSCSSISARKISERYDPVQISLYGIAIALLFTMPSAFVEARFTTVSVTPAAVAACIYLGVVGTAVAHTSWNYSLKLLNASVCSLFYPLQPLTSAILGVFIFGEIITKSFVLGGILICLGVVVSVIQIKKK